MTLPEGTVTFLRSDIEGSMELVRALGARYDELNAEHQTIVRSAVTEHRGQVVRTEGDAFFVVFTEAGAAARAAVDIQRAMADHDWPDGRAFKLRIGIHAGTATRAGDDYGGFEVNRAARIAAMGWGGQIIISDPARALIAASLSGDWEIRDLGRVGLKGVVEPEPVFQLQAPGLASAFPDLRDRAGPAEHLPTRLTSFIGRETEIREVGRLLGSNRLLTLTGPGGTGKTTLALEVARRHAGHLPDGTWFVDLQAVADPSQVRPEIAHGLGLFDGPAGSAAERLHGFVADRSMLVVIDNFEQVVEQADEVAQLLEVSPRSRLIITSRVPLRLSGEQEYNVRPLGLASAGEAADSEAVRLFLDRARRVRPDLRVDAKGASDVGEICRLVDGLPLAIELCAARVSALPIATILDRLSKRLSLPGSGPRDLPERQRTVEATVAWSYDLLAPALQKLFARLSVFHETFDYEQADVVCEPGDELGIDVLDGLVQLVEQSLVLRVDDEVGGIRFGMLESMSAFASKRLAETGQTDKFRERHARAYVELARATAAQLEELDPRRGRDRLEADDANLRAALDLAFDAQDVHLVLVGVGSLWRYWQLTGRLVEARERTQAALAMPGADAPTLERVRAFAADASIAYWQGDLDAARQGYDQQLALAEQLDELPEVADAWYSLIHINNYGGDVESGRRAEAAALKAFRQLGDDQGVAKVEVAAAASLTQAAFADPPQFLSELEARLERAEALADGWAVFSTMGIRAMVLLLQGDVAAATGMMARGMRRGCEVGHQADVVMMLPPIIMMALGRHSEEAAAVVLGAFRAAQDRHGMLTPTPFEAYRSGDPGEELRATMGDEAFAAAFERGSRMRLEETIDFIEAAMTEAP